MYNTYYIQEYRCLWATTRWLKIISRFLETRAGYRRSSKRYVKQNITNVYDGRSGWSGRYLWKTFDFSRFENFNGKRTPALCIACTRVYISYIPTQYIINRTRFNGINSYMCSETTVADFKLQNRTYNNVIILLYGNDSVHGYRRYDDILLYIILLWERPTRRPQVAIAICCNILRIVSLAYTFFNNV